MLPFQRTVIPYVVKVQTLITLAPADSARAAANLMAEKNIGAVLVMVEGRIAGIFTERDLAVRVVAAGLDPARTRLADVMTPDPDTIKPTETVRDALNRMAGRHYRHLPVVEAGRLVAIVSIRDLHRSIIEQMETDILMLAEALLKA
jgi:CBS domain-containing protein